MYFELNELPRNYKNASVRNLESFGFIWNLFEWEFKFESAFKFESKLERGLEEIRKGGRGLLLGREPKYSKSARPPLSLFPAHCDTSFSSLSSPPRPS
jgi:hypothetical protein